MCSYLRNGIVECYLSALKNSLLWGTSSWEGFAGMKRVGNFGEASAFLSI